MKYGPKMSHRIQTVDVKEVGHFSKQKQISWAEKTGLKHVKSKSNKSKEWRCHIY